MKIRMDFVTNSSSSSYIFGEPMGNSYTYDTVFKIFYDCCKCLLDAVDFLDKFIQENDKDMYSMVLKQRHFDNLYLVYYDKAYLKDGYGEVYRNKAHNCSEISYKYEQLVVGSQVYVDGLIALNEKYKFSDYGIDEEDLRYSFDDVYFNVYIKLYLHKLLEEEIAKHIVDFHGPDNEDMIVDVDESLSWFDWKGEKGQGEIEGTPEYYYRQIGEYWGYEDTDTEEGRKRQEIRSKFSYNNVALRQLGEVAILGYEDSNLPGLLKDMLESKTSLCCVHMG